MTLTLSVLRCPDGVPPETREVRGGEFAIGRGPDNDWVLPDPDRVMSKRHCMLAYRSGGWQVADLSSNGTFLNRGTTPIGQGGVQDLRDGDRLRFGAYEIELRIEEDAFAPPPPAARAAPDPFGAARPAALNPFHEDPFAAPPPAPAPFAGRSALAGRGGFDAGLASSAVSLPAEYDPLAPDPHDGPFAGPTQADHVAPMQDAFVPPRPVASLLPDDWDLDLSGPGLAPASGPAAVARPAASPSISPSILPGPAFAPPAALADDPFADLPDPFAEPEPEPPVPAARVQPAPAAPAAPQQVARPPAAAAPLPQPAPVLAPAAPPPAFQPPPSIQQAFPPPTDGAPAPADAALLAAFLAGAGLADARPADPLATMTALGRAFRALVTGLRQALIARASIKGEFRIEQTMIRSRGNNPLKFSAGDDDALTALLGVGRRVDMGPAEAVADALRDMRLHELASVTAMQTAVRALLAQLDPAALRRTAEQGGGMALVGVQRKARAWDVFEAQHTRIARALDDDFDSVFGRAFARAYEQALREAAAREES